MVVIGGLLELFVRIDVGGLVIIFGSDLEQCCLYFDVLIVFGMICDVGIVDWWLMLVG